MAVLTSTHCVSVCGSVKQSARENEPNCSCSSCTFLIVFPALKEDSCVRLIFLGIRIQAASMYAHQKRLRGDS